MGAGQANRVARREQELTVPDRNLRPGPRLLIVTPDCNRSVVNKALPTHAAVFKADSNRITSNPSSRTGGLCVEYHS